MPPIRGRIKTTWSEPDWRSTLSQRLARWDQPGIWLEHPGIMMGDIADAVHWQNLEALSVPVLAYMDGPVSMWPIEAFTALGGRVVGHITVLADERFEIFDSEAGNAGVDAVATSVANRFQDRLHSTVYTNGDNCSGQTQALARKGIHWTDAQFYPEPGCYLWAAAPGTTPGRLPSWCPVSPVAVQDRWMGQYDLSTTFGGWPTGTVHPPPAPPPPPPAPPSPTRINVQLLQVQEGNTGEAVRSLQILLNGRGGYALQIDGIFGPRTQAAVKGFQTSSHLGVDGIAGVHTWGSLLGVPQ